MARNHAEVDRYYRAVIVRTFTDGSGTFVTNCGPYGKRSSAKAQITRAESDAKASQGKYRDPAYAHSAVGHIETTEANWQRESAGE